MRIIGCPPEDCANREGNAWVEGRLTRQRVPRLRTKYDDGLIATRWLAPDEFASELNDRTENASVKRKLTRRHFIPAFALLIIILLVQIWLTTPMFQP